MAPGVRGNDTPAAAMKILGDGCVASTYKFAASVVQTSHLEPSSSGDVTDAAAPIPSPAAIPKPLKSKKRKAAEALLERKASKQRVGLVEEAGSAVNRPVAVAGCSSDCPCGSALQGLPSAAAAAAAALDMQWCSMPITVPSLDWTAILRAVSRDPQALSARTIEGTKAGLPGGIEIHVVQRHSDLIPALKALRTSMEDGVIGLDLEWRPDYRPGSSNPVALIQLASASRAVLIRTSRLGYSLPAALRHFFADESVTFVSFSWHSADEAKMTSTFGAGRALFARFLDLQCVAEHLGYQSIGLAGLTRRVLGVTMPKSRAVSRSDWQRAKLTRAQVEYAALDALLTGHVYRGLRLWHASPSACVSCKSLLGVAMACKERNWTSIECKECGKACRNTHGLLGHMEATGHDGGVAQCDACGRIKVT